MMHFFAQPAQAVITLISPAGHVGTEAFSSVKELVQYFLCGRSIEGSWGSEEQLKVLEETQELLTRTIEKVREEIAAERSLLLGVEKSPFDETWNKS